MLSRQVLVAAFDRNVQIIKLQGAGLSQTETLVQLPFRGNCMNWLVGHILTNRNNILKLVGGVGVLSPEQLAAYERESEPLNEASAGVLAFSDLIAALETSQARIAECIATLSEAELAASVAFFGNRSQPISEWVFFFYFHETYHVGQTEILRQAAGKDDKII